MGDDSIFFLPTLAKTNFTVVFVIAAAAGVKSVESTSARLFAWFSGPEHGIMFSANQRLVHSCSKLDK